MYPYINPTKFPEKMLLPKSEVKWKLHQEGVAGSNQRHQPGPAIPGARRDERMCVPKPIPTTPNPMFASADILSLRCNGNLSITSNQADFKIFLLNIKFFS